MWILKHISSDLQFSLLPSKTTYTVGRQDADISLVGDSTLSRHHATLLISTEQGILEVVDNESKYSIYFGEDSNEKMKRIESNTKIQLKENNVIKFGKGKYTFNVMKQNFNILTSTLNEAHKTELEQVLKTIGGQIYTTINDNCNYLVMSQAIMTLKLVQAMVNGLTIINVKYFRNVIKCISQHKVFPTAENYSPPLQEKLLYNDQKCLNVSLERKTLFKGKTFYFVSMRQYECYKDIIESASGKCECIRSTLFSKQKLIKDDVLVVKLEKDKSQTHLSSATGSLILELEEFIRSNGKRLITIDEIHLSIFHVSCDKHCNPLHTYKEVSVETKLPFEPLAHNTDDKIDVAGSFEELKLPQSASLSNELNSRTKRMDFEKHNVVSNKNFAIETVATGECSTDSFESVQQREALKNILSSKNDEDRSKVQKRKGSPLIIEKPTTPLTKKAKTDNEHFSKWCSKTKHSATISSMSKISLSGKTEPNQPILALEKSPVKNDNNIFGFNYLKKRKRSVTEVVPVNEESTKSFDSGFNFLKKRKRKELGLIVSSQIQSKKIDDSKTSTVDEAIKIHEHLYKKIFNTSKWMNKLEIVTQESPKKSTKTTGEESYIEKFQSAFNLNNHKTVITTKVSVESKIEKPKASNFKRFIKKKNVVPQTKTFETSTIIVGASQYCN